MTIFISWPMSIDADFRPAYLAATGEYVQDNPLINATGDLYMIGSSRVTQEQCEALQAEFTGMTFGNSPDDFGWVPINDQEQ